MQTNELQRKIDAMSAQRSPAWRQAFDNLQRPEMTPPADDVYSDFILHMNTASPAQLAGLKHGLKQFAETGQSHLLRSFIADAITLAADAEGGDHG